MQQKVTIYYTRLPRAVPQPFFILICITFIMGKGPSRNHMCRSVGWSSYKVDYEISNCIKGSKGCQGVSRVIQRDITKVYNAIANIKEQLYLPSFFNQK